MFEVTEAWNCHFKSRSRFHVVKLVNNDISHLIIGLLVEIVFSLNWPLAAILDSCCFWRNSGFIGTFRKEIWLFRDTQILISALTPKCLPKHRNEQSTVHFSAIMTLETTFNLEYNLGT